MQQAMQVEQPPVKPPAKGAQKKKEENFFKNVNF